QFRVRVRGSGVFEAWCESEWVSNEASRTGPAPGCGAPWPSTLLRTEALHQVGIVRQVLGQNTTETLNVVAPVTMQLTTNAEPVHQLGAGLLHTAPGCISSGLIERAGGISNHEHLKPFFQRRQCWERDAHIGHHARDQQLFLPGGLHGLYEVFVVPGIDLTRKIGRASCRD